MNGIMAVRRRASIVSVFKRRFDYLKTIERNEEENDEFGLLPHNDYR